MIYAMKAFRCFMKKSVHKICLNIYVYTHIYAYVYIEKEKIENKQGKC